MKKDSRKSFHNDVKNIKKYIDLNSTDPELIKLISSLVKSHHEIIRDMINEQIKLL